MNNVVITQLSTNMLDYININGNLDIENKKMNFEISFDDYKKIFNTDLRKTASNIDLFVIDNCNKKYSCIGCIAGFTFGSIIKFKVVNINLIFENFIGQTEKIMTNHIEFETTYPRHYLYGCYINDLKIKYTQSKTIIISKSLDEQYIKLNFSIDSKIPAVREKLDDLLYTVLEIIYLIFGSMPKLNRYKFKYNNEDVIVYFDLANKYIQNTKSGSNDDALAIIDEKILTKDLIKRFIKFRKETSILYDMFLINGNSDNYTEITNCMLIQLIEGTYRTFNPGVQKELWEILDYYFIQNTNTKMILNKKDLKNAKDVHNTPIFLYKAKEHRHYLSHLNMNESKKVFYQLENNYAKFKLILCLRLVYMEYLGINYEKDKLNKIIKSINDWGNRNKIKI